MIRRLLSSAADFDTRLQALLAWETVVDNDVQATVAAILAQVKTEGDAALLRYTRRFDQRDVTSINELLVEPSQLAAALHRISPAQRRALEQALARITAFHKHQRSESWQFTDAHGNVLGQQLTPLDRVGVYVPGGKASYPSSVLMNVIPARVAGVGHITMAVPMPGGDADDRVLAAAYLAGVDQLLTAGGAQAIAALAYGTDSVQRVDKIVGPGNRFVAEAKRQVFGQVGLDMIAGPSEILVVCDGKTPADWITMDLFSQAEHDEMAQAILVCPDVAYLDEVEATMKRLLPTMPRAAVIRQSLAARGALIHVQNMTEAIALVNTIAPEHLELSVQAPQQYLPAIRHAGAVFMGPYTPEAFGDYCAGPNHVLPTAGTARFSSPLGVYDFQKRSSLIHCSVEGAAVLADIAAELAEAESLTAHAESARLRGSLQG